MEARLIHFTLAIAATLSLGASHRTPNFVIDAPTKEFAKEMEDLTLVRQSSPLGDTIEGPMNIPDPSQAGPQIPVVQAQQGSGPISAPVGQPAPQQQPQPVTAPGEQEPKRSFWSRFKRKPKQ